MSKINAPVKLEWDQRDGVKCNFGLLEIIRMSGDILWWSITAQCRRGLLLWYILVNNIISFLLAKLSIQIEISMTFFFSLVKRKQTAQNSARQRRDDSPAYSIPVDLQRDNKSSLDVLSCMIHEVEHELEEYERCTGREVKKMQKSEGLTGFTLSLVNALCRLMRYLKEVRRIWVPSVEWM